MAEGVDEVKSDECPSDLASVTRRTDSPAHIKGRHDDPLDNGSMIRMADVTAPRATQRTTSEHSRSAMSRGGGGTSEMQAPVEDLPCLRWQPIGGRQRRAATGFVKPCVKSVHKLSHRDEHII